MDLSRTALAVTVIAVVALGPCTAQAQPHRVCLYFDLGSHYWDASPRTADGEDFREEYGRNEGDRSFPAQRWLAHVIDVDSGQELFGWGPLDATGCADLELEDGIANLGVEWMRWAVWEQEPETGNQIVGYACTASMEKCTLLSDTRVQPADLATGVTNVVVPWSEVVPMDGVMWAASFAEERFASLGEQPLDNTRIYVSHDELDVLPGATQADRTFGNQASVVIEGSSWQSKNVIAHEYGHQQTIGASNPSFGPADLDYCYDATLYPASGAGCMGDHALRSHEWQAAAATEGIAHWYAVSVWNDVDLVECPSCQSGVYYVSPRSSTEASTYAVPRGSPRCTEPFEPQCPAGVGNEWDWLSAFRLFRLQAADTPSFRSMFRMLSATFAAGPWPRNAADDSFFVAFDQTMAVHLGPSHAAWQAAASEMELAR